MGISRRSLIVGSVLGAAGGIGSWALLANFRLVPGRSAVDLVLGRCDLEAQPVEAEPGAVIGASFFSAHRQRTVGYAIAYPPGVPAGTPVPVCVVLHGSDADERTPFDGLGYHRLLAGAVAAGVPPFALASVDGGSAFWHPRADGDNPLGMVLEDFPIILAQHGLSVQRFALAGWSMGGYGALLAASEAPERVVAVAATSPAIWGTYDDAHDANAEAFGGGDEWRTWGDLRTRTSALKDLKVRIDCGDSDPFAPAISTLRERLPGSTTVQMAPGCHDNTYWRSVAPDQFRFIGEALTPPAAPA